jgi:hypothetical protein
VISTITMLAKISATQNVHLQEATVNSLMKWRYHIQKGNLRRRDQELDRGKGRQRRLPLLYLFDGAIISNVTVLRCTCQISARVPPAFARGEEPNVPAINRETINVAAVSEVTSFWTNLDFLRVHKVFERL